MTASKRIDIIEVGEFNPDLASPDKDYVWRQWCKWLEQRVAGEAAWANCKPDVRDPQTGKSAAMDYLEQSYGHMVWHHDMAVYGSEGKYWMAVWANKYPTLIRKMNHQTEIALKPGVVYLFSNEHLEHRTPPEAATEERWFARMYYKPGVTIKTTDRKEN